MENNVFVSLNFSTEVFEAVELLPWPTGPGWAINVPAQICFSTAKIIMYADTLDNRRNQAKTNILLLCTVYSILHTFHVNQLKTGEKTSSSPFNPQKISESDSCPTHVAGITQRKESAAITSVCEDGFFWIVFKVHIEFLLMVSLGSVDSNFCLA